MTRKDFVLIAEVLAAYPSFNATLRAHRDSMARAFADRLAETNGAFDRARFLRAAGVETAQEVK